MKDYQTLMLNINFSPSLLIVSDGGAFNQVFQSKENKSFLLLKVCIEPILNNFIKFSPMKIIFL